MYNKYPVDRIRRVVLNLSTKSERILLVDAEPFIVDLVSQLLLRKIGYTVDACRDFKEAMNAFRKNPEAAR